MDNTTKLRVMFDLVDNMTKPLQMMLTGNQGLAASLRATRRELDDMAKTQKRISEFRDLRSGVARTATDLKLTKLRIGQLRVSLRESGPPSRQMIDDFDNVQRSATELTATQGRQVARIRELRAQLIGAGVETRNLDQHELNLAVNSRRRQAQMRADVLAYDDGRRKRAEARRAKLESLRAVGQKWTERGKAVKGVGTEMFGMLSKPLDAAKQAESETLRMRAQGASADAVKFARTQQVSGQSTSDNLTLMRESLSALGGDEQRARVMIQTVAEMKSANEALYGKDEAKANVDKFMGMLKVIDLRGRTKDKTAGAGEADAVQKMLLATGGNVSSDEWNNFAESGGGAARRLRTDAFYYQMQPLIEKLGGKAAGEGLAALSGSVLEGKASAPAARRLAALGLVDPKQVRHGRNGAISGLKPGALAGSAMLQASPLEWLEKVLLPKLAAKGITSPDKIKATIATLFPDKAAGGLLSKMVELREQIHDTERQSANADGIGALNAKGMASTQGRELAALAQLRDLQLEIGERVAPLYNKALDLTASAIGKVVRFMREHPAAANVIVTTLTVLAGLFVAVGTLATVFGTVLSALPVLQFASSMLGAFGMIGQALLVLGRLALANPLLAVISVIAMAAFYVWQHWDTLGPKFIALWETIKGAFGAAGDWITAKWDATVEWVKTSLAGIGDWFGSIGTRFQEIGASLVSGLVDGITNRLGTLKDSVGNLGSSALGWLKEKLGMQDSAASAAPGNGTGGADTSTTPTRTIRTAAALTTAAALVGPPAFAASPAIGAAAPLERYNTPLDYRPPLTAPAAFASAAPASGPITINIAPPPGADPAEIARLVRAELERAERAKASRTASRLSD
ncbi:membrane protein [Burkholderia sp. MSh2]|uniref:Membrane protein n=1 Tax=Burkholderia paludis TaxID=1506587 RepID=A0A6J5DZ55_9BURK|nr:MULTISPECIES: hypothetical protein [Burkholderia]KEZ07183.1 membrane protein [Burkholderia sp. MSh2]CAB3758551.1 hypothetical protein LMG30113_03206 [Burkholderia paludis]VWB73015.1 membrane protein [Burkholderia paludis]